MAEGNSQLNTLLEENENSELPSHIEGAGELSPPSQKEGDDGKGNNYVQMNSPNINIICLPFNMLIIGEHNIVVEKICMSPYSFLL